MVCAFSPLPALLMLPWVAVAGLAQVQTVLFCAFFGALNVSLVDSAFAGAGPPGLDAIE